jgi:hypothetical protein
MPARIAVLLLHALLSTCRIISQLTSLHVELNPLHHFCLQVLADDRVNSYFQSTDMVKQKAHQVGSFLSNCGPSVQWLQYMMPGNMQAAIV